MDGDPIPYKQGGIGSRFQETISVTGSKAASAFFCVDDYWRDQATARHAFVGVTSGNTA